MTRFDSRAENEAGFTLIEVMIALVIMGIGTLTIALAQLTALRMSTESRQMTQAMYLAEQQLDQFYISPPVLAGNFQDPGNPIDIDPADTDLTTYNRSWAVQLNTPSPGLSTVTVQVVWNNGQGGPGDTGPASRTATLQGIVGP